MFVGMLVYMYFIYMYVCDYDNGCVCMYTGCPRSIGPNFGGMFLRSNYNDLTKTPISNVQWLRRYWPEKFETLTAITQLLITKYILKLAGIRGFCNVNICT